jgi:hypothetical protein
MTFHREVNLKCSVFLFGLKGEAKVGPDAGTSGPGNSEMNGELQPEIATWGRQPFRTFEQVAVEEFTVGFIQKIVDVTVQSVTPPMVA